MRVCKINSIRRTTDVLSSLKLSAVDRILSTFVPLTSQRFGVEPSIIVANDGKHDIPIFYGVAAGRSAISVLADSDVSQAFLFEAIRSQRAIYVSNISGYGSGFVVPIRDTDSLQLYEPTEQKARGFSLSGSSVAGSRSLINCYFYPVDMRFIRLLPHFEFILKGLKLAVSHRSGAVGLRVPVLSASTGRRFISFNIETHKFN